MLRLKELRKKAGISQTKFAEQISVSRSTVAMWETGASQPDNNTLIKIAEYFCVSVDYLLGNENKVTDRAAFPSPNITENFVTFPVIGDIAAGYDTIAAESWDGDTINIPAEYLKGRDQEEFFVLRVKGNSMYPAFRDGDKVLILKQETMNDSGEIGAVLYDGEYVTLKKIEYVPGEDWMNLVPLNPEYMPKKITGSDLERCRVIGLPKLLIREL